MRATKKLGNKGLPVVHSWLEIRICVKNIVSSTSTWLEFVSQAAIFMGPVGAILLGNGSRWGFTRRRIWPYCGVTAILCYPHDGAPAAGQEEEILPILDRWAKLIPQVSG